MPRANALTNNNLGGPGASGFEFVLGLDEASREELLGPQWNLVGFDPRGVKSNDINLDCSPGHHEDRVLLRTQIDGNLADYTSPLSLHEAWELGRGWGERCRAVQHEGRKSKYVNTVAVAYDMLRFTEVRAQSLGQPPEQSKLWYYGASYGTVLGATFATLFPDRLGGMVLNGVLDADDWYAGGRKTSQLDADKVAKTFFTYCFGAGPDRCAFYGNASGPDKIEQRFNELLIKLDEHPIVVSNPNVTSKPVRFGSGSLKALFFEDLYDASGHFPEFARTLVGLEQGDVTSLFESSGSAGSERPLNDSAPYHDDNQAHVQIICADTNGRYNVSSFEQYVAQDKYLRNQSLYGGEGEALVYAVCRGLDIKPPRSQILNGKAADSPLSVCTQDNLDHLGTVSANETSAPILFMSSTLDPVSPLRSAKIMSSRFGGSALLTVERTGVSYSRRSDLLS